MYLGIPKLNLSNKLLQVFRKIQIVCIGGTKLVQSLVVWPSNFDVLLILSYVAKPFVYSNNSQSLSQHCSLGIVIFSNFL